MENQQAVPSVANASEERWQRAEEQRQAAKQWKVIEEVAKAAREMLKAAQDLTETATEKIKKTPARAPRTMTREHSKGHMKTKPLTLFLLLLLSACIEQRAQERFTATVNRLCVATSPEHTVDQHLSTHPQGCVLVSLDKTLAAGLTEVGVTPGVYTTQATSLGFTQYLDAVVVARAGDTVAVMTPAAFHELAAAAGAVHEARLEEQQLREGLGLVILGHLQAFAPATPTQLTPDQLILLRKGL